MNGMHTVLLTGTTGFVGSSIAASLLSRGHRVLSVSRNDPSGARARQAVAGAAAGFGLELSEPQWANLRLEEISFENPSLLETSLRRAGLSDVTEAWHCAAFMSYSPKRLSESMAQNLVATTRLYETLRSEAPGCRRFHHVSTAYTAGIDGGQVAERLHPAPRLINSYQISKWCAEQALANLAREGGMPVTVFRPTIVVGHSETGWAPATGFGFYMFLQALRLAAAAGIRRVTLDVEPGTRPDVVAIDDVARAAVALTEREGMGAAVEVMHCSGASRLTTGEHIGIMAASVGIEAAFGPAQSEFDRRINEGIAWNRDFASTEWDFERSRLVAEGGDVCRASALGRAAIERIVAHYLETAVEPSGQPRAPAMRHPLPTVQGLDVFPGLVGQAGSGRGAESARQCGTLGRAPEPGTFVAPSPGNPGETWP